MGVSCYLVTHITDSILCFIYCTTYKHYLFLLALISDWFFFMVSMSFFMLLKFLLSSLSIIIAIVLLVDSLPLFHLVLFLELSPVLSFEVCFFASSFWLSLCVCFCVLGRSVLSSCAGRVALCSRSPAGPSGTVSPITCAGCFSNVHCVAYVIVES